MIFGRLWQTGGFDAGGHFLNKYRACTMPLQKISCYLDTYRFMIICLTVAIAGIMKPGSQVENKAILFFQLIKFRHFHTGGYYIQCMLYVMKPDAFTNFILK